MFLMARMMTLWPIVIGLGIGPARMICVTSEVLSARGFLVGRCSASSAGRFPRTSLRVRGFAGARGVVDFGGKRAGGGTFGCSACDVCLIRSAQFSARAQN